MYNPPNTSINAASFWCHRTDSSQITPQYIWLLFVRWYKESANEFMLDRGTIVIIININGILITERATFIFVDQIAGQTVKINTNLCTKKLVSGIREYKLVVVLL